MLTDNNDDENGLPEDVLASDEEIAEAVAHARASPEVNVRLLHAAKFILFAAKQLKRTCEPEDLLQDAIEAVLDGRRKWRTNRVDFRGLLVGVMRSMASSRSKTLVKKVPDVMMEHELPLVGEEQARQNLEELSSDVQTTEDVVLRAEQATREENLMATLRAKYGLEDLHGRILDSVNEGFSSHTEVREALGVEESEYRNAWKALMRAATSLNSSAEE